VKLLLDTCTFLWIATEPERVPEAVLERFQDPEVPVFLSAASAWEIALKSALGRLTLPEPPERFVPTCREQHRIEALAIDEESALRVRQLPAHHRDPFDRILVAQALVNGLSIATPDEDVRAYPVQTLW
jgi:PIN domain nuclease of toxin-antitoxin system